jgi:hypothetical protein
MMPDRHGSRLSHQRTLPAFGLASFGAAAAREVFSFSTWHVALGGKYRGRKVRQDSVRYCALEGCAPFKNRIEAFRQSRLAKHTKPVPFHLMASPMTLVADHPALIESFRLRDPRPSIVVIDTLNRSLAGSESSDEDMSAYVKAADAIRDAFNCLVVIVHHCGHDGTRPRGHSSLLGALDAQIAVKRDEADNVIATVELMKDGSQGDDWGSRDCRSRIDDDGDESLRDRAGRRSHGTEEKRPSRLAPPKPGPLHEILNDAGIIPPRTPYSCRHEAVTEWREHASNAVSAAVNSSPNSKPSAAPSISLPQITASPSRNHTHGLCEDSFMRRLQVHGFTSFTL